MSFLTVLEHVGEDIAKFFVKAEPVVEEAQTVAAPLENALLPGLSALIQTGINAIANAQAMGVAAGNTNGSDSVKLASVIASLATSAGPTLVALGVNPATVTNAQYTSFINALVEAANVFVTTQTTAFPPTPSTNPAPVAAVQHAEVVPAVPTFTNNNGLVTPAPVTGAAVPPK